IGAFFHHLLGRLAVIPKAIDRHFFFQRFQLRFAIREVKETSADWPVGLRFQ
ncbi:uncharacterized protein METZ01_LOCUS434750, partial [marine metagenome]